MQKRLLIVTLLLCLLVSCKKDIDVTGVTVSEALVEMEVGQTYQLGARVQPADATDPTVFWITDNPSVATVTDDGLVTAVGAGEAEITAGAGVITSSCTVKVKEKTIPVTSVTLDCTTLTLLEGESAKLTATVKPDDATQRRVIWSSSDESVATVDTHGKVVAGQGGVCAIVATNGDRYAACAVSVSKKIVRVESIEISRSSLNLMVGESETLTASVLPQTATDQSYAWASTNPDIADVDQNGKVTARTAGTATITVTTADGGHIAACEVTSYIPFVPVTDITLSRSEATMAKGGTVTITATVYPENASVKTVNWSSDAPGVACFNQNGEIMAVSAGHATITAKAGNCIATCQITVIVPVTGISLNKNEIVLEEGESETLIVAIAPEDATDRAVTWSSSNSSVAVADASGRVSAKAAGTAVISVTTADGLFTDSCRVTVKPAQVPVSSITINKTGIVLETGASEKLTATVLPANATDKSVSWTSSAASVATVDASGRVTAVGMGTATITATAGGKSANCTVTVTQIMVSSITVSDAGVDVGGKVTLVAAVLPDNAADKSVVWTSDDAEVATVSSTGVVSGHRAGIAKITVTANDGSGVSGSCTVTVSNVAVTSVRIDPDEITVYEGKTASLSAVVEPENATDKSVVWSSDNTSAVTVDASGHITAVRAGIAVITVTTRDGGKTGTCTVTVTEQEDEYEWVDLELPSGLKWATCNVGADSPEEYGDYFAWGEVGPKSDYHWTTYSWSNGTGKVLSKYNNQSTYGEVDNKMTLDRADDAAFANWDGIWRMPTREDFEELLEACTQTWETLNGVYGRRLTSRNNGKSIFFPAAGRMNGVGSFDEGVRGYYWSSSLHPGDPALAGGFFFLSTTGGTYHYHRYLGLTVRPVK